MPDDTEKAAPGAEAPVSFERERLALEAERLALEKERRRVELSPAFRAVLRPPPGARPSDDDAADPGKWLPRRRTVFPEDLVLIR